MHPVALRPHSNDACSPRISRGRGMLLSSLSRRVERPSVGLENRNSTNAARDMIAVSRHTVFSLATSRKDAPRQRCVDRAVSIQPRMRDMRCRFRLHDDRVHVHRVKQSCV